MQFECVYRVLAVAGRENNVEFRVDGAKFICKCDTARPSEIDIEESNITVIGLNERFRLSSSTARITIVVPSLEMNEFAWASRESGSER